MINEKCQVPPGGFFGLTHFIITHPVIPKADTHFTTPRKVEG